jgi:gliding motility-associated-like protein
LSCDVQNVELQGSSNGMNYEYLWSGPGISTQNQNETNPVIDLPGVYTLVVTDPETNCSSVPDSVIITDIAFDVVAVIQDAEDLTCYSTIISLDALNSTSGENIIYLWENQDGQLMSSSPMIEVGQAGMYIFHVVDTLTGCTDSDTVSVLDLTEYPPAEAGDDQSIDCNIDIVQLNENVVNVAPHLVFGWSGPSGGIVSDTSEIQIEAVMPGWYYISVLDTITGCQNTDSVFVSDNTAPPDAEAGPDLTLDCVESFAQLNALLSSTGDMIIYVWDGPGIQQDTIAEFETAVPGVYYLSVINSETGCVATDSVEIIEGEYLTGADIEEFDAICLGDNTGIISVESVIGGTPDFEYSLDGIIFQDGPVFEGLYAGEYSIVIRDNNNCEWETSVVVNEGQATSIELGPDINIHIGDTIHLGAEINIPPEQIDSIVWGPSGILSCNVCPNPILTAINTMQISATVYAGNFCEATDELTIFVDRNPNLYIPNAFSPNGDNVNDKAFISAGDEVLRIVDFEIFDRWGEKVFSRKDFPANDVDLGWDGSFKGSIMQPAVFVYKARIELIDGTFQTVTGDITIVR